MNQMLVRRTGLFLGIILFLVVISFGKIDGLSTDGQITLAVFLLMGVLVFLSLHRSFPDSVFKSLIL